MAINSPCLNVCNKRAMKQLPTPSTNRVVAYLRVSTEEQARSGLGLEAQRTAIQLAADSRGWELTWLVDDGYTGSNTDRPGLATALRLLKSGEAHALVVSKLDRLSRSLIDFAQMLETARDQKWALVALDLGVDTSTPTGELIANVMMAVAQWERRTIGQRTTDALAALRAQGVTLGRPRVLSDALAERVGQWRAAGVSFSAIAEHLNATDVPTAHGGAKWYASTVRQVYVSHEKRSA